MSLIVYKHLKPPPFFFSWKENIVNFFSVAELISIAANITLKVSCKSSYTLLFCCKIFSLIIELARDKKKENLAV